MNTKKSVLEKLRKVLDPELRISVVDLGLIYDVKIKKNNVEIVYTLTTPGCPLSEVIEMLIKAEIPGAKTTLTFDPPWDASRMSESAKANLGMI